MPSPNNEHTFGDRLARGVTMKEKIAGYTPAFEPDDTDLTAANFGLFLKTIETKNGLVAAAEAEENTAITNHRTLYTGIKDRTLRVVDTVEGNKALTPYLPKLKEYAAKVRNSRPPKRKPAAPGGPQPPRRNSGEQSYGDIDKWFEKVIEAVKAIPGYAPAASTQCQVAQLQTLLEDYRSAGKIAAEKIAAADRERGERLPLYNAKTGSLRSNMKAIKKATAAQYGRRSTQYAEIKSIAL